MISGLYKTTLVHRQSPWHNMQDLEMATLGGSVYSTTGICLLQTETSCQRQPEQKFYEQHNMLDMVD